MVEAKDVDVIISGVMMVLAHQLKYKEYMPNRKFLGSTQFPLQKIQTTTPKETIPFLFI